MPQEIPVHPAALLFPMMSEKELSDLADDIAANGLMEPVVLYHGQILDGRNRLAACELGGVEPRFVEVDGELPSATIYVLSKNLHRRHLTTSQRVAIAADVVPLLQAESHAKQISCLKNQPVSSFPPQGGNEQKQSARMAAQQLEVGTRTVERELEVKRKNPELHERVKNGELTVGEASRMVPKNEESTKFKKGHSVVNKRRAPAQKERLISGLANITGLCRGLTKELDLESALSVCSDEDRQMLLDRAKESIKNLRAFISNFERITTNA